jgi:hypothetical protein
MPHDDAKIPGHPEGLPPETHNAEQDARSEQAQYVAKDAQAEGNHTASPLESTKPASDNFAPAPPNQPDLIDEMRRMEGEGRIDMSAFAGEPNHDDEAGTYGGETTDNDDDDWLTADGEPSADDEEE